jgi:tetratricopeptide (TPR) repeat protein
MRSFSAAAPSLLEWIVRPYQADVFVHTWSDRGISNNVHKRMLPLPMGKFLKAEPDLERFRKRFPQTYEQLFAAVDTVTADDVRAAYGDDATVVVEDYPEDERAFFGTYPPPRLLDFQPKSKWSVPMFYKIDAANRLKSAREKAEGFTYDVVIRIRPDLKVGGDFLVDRVDTPGVVYHRIRTIDPQRQMTDQFFFGDSAAMDQASSLFQRLPDIYASIPEDLERPDADKYWAEGLLHTYITGYTDVKPVAFRTEPFHEKSSYRLLGSDQRRIGFEEFFWAFRDDLLSTDDPKGMESARRGSARAMFHFCQRLAPGELDRVRKLIDVAERDDLFDVRPTQGLLAMRAKKYVAAERIFQELVDESPKAALLLFWLGRAQHALGKSEEALATLERGIAAPLEYESHDPAQRWQMFFWMGRVRQSQKDWRGAAQAYEVANGLAPGRIETLLRLGRVLRAAGDLHRAISVLQSATAVAPDNREARFLLADCLVRVGSYRPVVSAIWPYSIAETAADQPEMLPVLAEAYVGIRRYEMARECIEALLAGHAGTPKLQRTAVVLAKRISPEYAQSVRARIPAATVRAIAKPPAPRGAPSGLLRRGVRRALRIASRVTSALRR